MAEMVAGALLSVVFKKLYEQLASLKVELGTNSEGSKLKMFEEKLKEVSLYLDDAEDRQLSDKKVKEWLDELKHVVFMADELVDMINNSKKKNTFVRWIKSVRQFFAKKGEIDLILEDLDHLLHRATVLELKHISSSEDLKNRRSSPDTPLRDERHVYGRKAEKEEILKMLLSEEDKMIVLPIVGMGGLGKTTLAQLVYNDNRVEEHGFSLKAWVTVSTEFDFCTIMKGILQKVNPRTSCSNINDTNELQRHMKESLRGKRFLIVLDNVWDENYRNWDLLMTNFRAGDPRSRVIVTTRSRDVGSMVKTGPIHELKEVQKDDCWSIFVHHAFNGDKDACPQLQKIGRRIVEKCKGLPLAIIYLGGHLHSKRSSQKWEDILGCNWSKVMEKEVLPSLWLSYGYLSSTLKQCFAYCSLFPQDYEFKKKEIVLLWMAEGFIQEGKSMEDEGQEYFDGLVSRSLFQRSSEDDDKHVVHDLVHDLAAFVYGNFCLRVGEDLKNVTIKTRHLTYKGDVSSDLLTSLSTSKHLRTLIHHGVSSDFVKDIVLKVRFLRVLTISLARSVVCDSLGDLKMLRYLNLSGSEIEELPDSICSLFHLQTLILFRCHGITQLPTDLPRKLSKLRYLGTNCTGLTKMPPKMGSFKELRIVANFVLGRGDGSDCSRLKELGELHHLGGLGISNLENVDDLGDVEKANLKNKEEMKELLLRWEANNTSNMILAVRVLLSLEPHTNLEKLELHNYPGSTFPKWVGQSSFSKMASVRLNGSFNCLCRVLPPLGQLPSLRELRIECFKQVKKIGNEFLNGNDTNSSITPFLCLESLEFYDMGRWKEWSFVGNETGCFPRLKQLRLIGCPELDSIIRDDDRPEIESTQLYQRWPSLCQLIIYLCPLLKSIIREDDQHWPSLSLLRISHCPLLERRYQKKKGDHWRYISHIPDINITGQTTILELSDELEREEEEMRQGEENSQSEPYYIIKVILIILICFFIFYFLFFIFFLN